MNTYGILFCNRFYIIETNNMKKNILFHSNQSIILFAITTILFCNCIYSIEEKNMKKNILLNNIIRNATS